MAVRDVLVYPHASLKRRCRELTSVERDLARQVAADLLDTMRAHTGCVGIAAPQIDELVRVLVVDVSEHPRGRHNNGLLALVNPAVTSRDGTAVAREGCLSIPHLTADVRRATSIELSATTPDGDPLRLTASGFEARCLLHELDHLDGLLFLDRVDSLAGDLFRRVGPR